MSTEESVQIVKDAFAAISHGDMSNDAIEWIILDKWQLAATCRGHA